VQTDLDLKVQDRDNEIAQLLTLRMAWIRTVAVPLWVRGHQRLDDGRGDRRGKAPAEHREGRQGGTSLSDWAVWSVVEQSGKEIGIAHFGAHDLRRTCANSAGKAAVTSTNQVPAGAQLDPDHRALSRVRAGNFGRGE